MTPAILTQARRHLSRRDPVMKGLCAAVGRCTLQPHDDPFEVLVRSIVSQMISTKAARAIAARLIASMPNGQLTPQALAAAEESAIRAAGLSGAKARSLHDLAQRTFSGALPLERFPAMSDDDVIDSLVAVRGIGRWTAEMFLIFCLGRLDVLPVDDLGLRAGVRDVYGLPDLPKAAALRALGEPWRPYRSIATWYLWRSRGGVPQSE